MSMLQKHIFCTAVIGIIVFLFSPQYLFRTLRRSVEIYNNNLSTNICFISFLIYCRHTKSSIHTTLILNTPLQPIIVKATTEINDDDDVILAEIIAQEKKEQGELAQLEAEMRELEALKAKQREAAVRMNNQKMKSRATGRQSHQFDELDEQLRQKEAKAQEVKRVASAQAYEEAIRINQEERAREREVAFQVMVNKMNDEKKKKALKKQKTNDAKIVRRILHQSANGMHYGVLGINCKWGEFKIGPLKFCTVSSSKIKHAFRSMARRVHPDKNRDGRAEEAFLALEKSLEILSDVKKKKEYDATLSRQRKETIQQITRLIRAAWNVICETFCISKNILGPFFTPLVTFAILII